MKNPNSNAGLKNITKVVRFKTDDNDRRCERRPLKKISKADVVNDGY